MKPPAGARPPIGLGDLPRWLLYLAALVFLGALAVPLILPNRRVGRGEKTLLCALGISQTAAALVLLVGMAVWFLAWFRKLAAP